MPIKFRKRPVVIEAMRWYGTADGAAKVTNWVQGNGGQAQYVPGGKKIPGPGRGITTLNEHIAISTLEGTMRANPGDWIIRGVQGEFYSCKPDIFADTYDPEDE